MPDDGGAVPQPSGLAGGPRAAVPPTPPMTGARKKAVHRDGTPMREGDVDSEEETPALGRARKALAPVEEEEEKDGESSDDDSTDKLVKALALLLSKKGKGKGKGRIAKRHLSPGEPDDNAETDALLRPFHRFKYEPRFEGGDNPLAARAVLAALARQYSGQERWYNNDPDSVEQVKELREALTGRAAAWYDKLWGNEFGEGRSEIMSSYSTLADAFAEAFCDTATVEDPFANLYSLSQTGQYSKVNDYAVEFRSRVQLLPASLPDEALVAAFVKGLGNTWAGKMDQLRIARFGGGTNWPTLKSVMSAAQDLASNERSHKAVSNNAAELSEPVVAAVAKVNSATPQPKANSGRKQRAKQGEYRHRFSEAEREKLKLCGFCEQPDHERKDCQREKSRLARLDRMAAEKRGQGKD